MFADPHITFWMRFVTISLKAVQAEISLQRRGWVSPVENRFAESAAVAAILSSAFRVHLPAAAAAAIAGVNENSNLPPKKLLYTLD